MSTLPKNESPAKLESPDSGSLPIQAAKVYNLVVLVESTSSGVRARAANLKIGVCSGDTIRGALSKLVESAKAMLRELQDDSQIPWIEPPESPGESESRFVVPLHL